MAWFAGQFLVVVCSVAKRIVPREAFWLRPACHVERVFEMDMHRTSACQLCAFQQIVFEVAKSLVAWWIVASVGQIERHNAPPHHFN